MTGSFLYLYSGRSLNKLGVWGVTPCGQLSRVLSLSSFGFKIEIKNTRTRLVKYGVKRINT